MCSSSQLAHQTSRIPDMPQVRRLPINEMHNVHMRDGYLFACGGETLKRTSVRPGHGGTERDEFPFCEHIVDLEVQVGKTGAQHGDHLFEVRGKVRSQGFLVVNPIGNQSLINDGQIAFIECLARALFVSGVIVLLH